MKLTNAELRELIASGAFELYGQPKWTFGKNTCNTYEVFAEMIHLPDGKSVRGYDYLAQISLCDETAELFTSWFLKESLRMMRRLIDETGCALVSAVDVWAYSVNKKDFVDTVKAELAECGLEPKNLEFELANVGDLTDCGVENLKTLKELGVTLLLDNFGVGGSDLFVLNKLPFDGIKLARCFAVGVPEDEKLDRILVSIHHLADTLGITVCAKGIENGDQFEFFHDLGYNKGQGYMIGAPMPEAELKDYVANFAIKG